MTLPKTLITGAAGMLGRALVAELGPAALATDRPELDILDPDAIAAFLDHERPGTLVNCAAWTDVDGAESQREGAFALNATAVDHLARACAAREIHFMTISTDYVFTGAGKTPWPEDAPAKVFGPASIYGASKLAGEAVTRAAGGAWAIVRTQWLYGAGGKNFIDTIARVARERGAAGPPLRVVNDQIGAPTWVRDLARGLCVIIERRAEGIFHFANSGQASWYDVACEVLRIARLECPIEPCTSNEFPRPAQRPANSRLSLEKYSALAGTAPRPWQVALAEYLGEARS